jgi:uncharacterized membrane protein YdjX (TVP38/TMEM64 family)
MTRSNMARLTLLAALILALVLSLVFLDELRRAFQDFLEWVDGLGIVGHGLFVVFYGAAAVFLIPGSVLTLGAGAIFGFWGGYIAVTLGSLAGSAAAFLVGRTVGRGWVEQKLAGSPRLLALDRAVRNQGFKIVLLTRLSPVFPYTLLNYAYSLTGVSFGVYFLASWIGMVPGTVMYVYLGSGLKNLAQLFSGDYEGGTGAQVLFFGGLAATVVVTVYVTRLARRALQQAGGAQETRSTSRNNSQGADEEVPVFPSDGPMGS